MFCSTAESPVQVRTRDSLPHRPSALEGLGLCCLHLQSCWGSLLRFQIHGGSSERHFGAPRFWQEPRPRWPERRAEHHLITLFLLPLPPLLRLLHTRRLIQRKTITINLNTTIRNVKRVFNNIVFSRLVKICQTAEELRVFSWRLFGNVLVGAKFVLSVTLLQIQLKKQTECLWRAAANKETTWASPNCLLGH